MRERDEIAASLQQVEKELFRTALERNYLQSQVTESAKSQWSACPVQVQDKNRYWCDNSGIYLEGWISQGNGTVSLLRLEAGGSRSRHK